MKQKRREERKKRLNYGQEEEECLEKEKNCWEKKSNDGQKDQEPLEKEEQRLEKEAMLDVHSPGSAWRRRIRVSPTPVLGGIYRPAPGKRRNDGFGALLGKQPRSGSAGSAGGLDACADNGPGFISSRIFG